MGLKITGLNELRERLERLRPEEVMARALAEQAERMAARVRGGLSAPQGASGHDEPWLQTGALRDSVGPQADGLQAVVGSSDPAAVPQELGTARVPPRPFLAPVAAGIGEEVARAVAAAAAVMAALRGNSPDAGSARVDLSGDGLDGSDSLYGGAIAGVGTPRTHDGGFMLASGKADGKNDPLRELRKDLGEEIPEEEEKEIEHGKFSPLHVPGIPPGGGALPFGPGRLDAGSSPPAPRTASPQPSPPARPAASGAAPTGQSPAQAMPGSPAAPRPAAPGGQEATPAATGTAAEAARFGRAGAEYKALARDPAQGGKSSLKTEQERRVGLELEKRGDVPGPITRDPTGKAEFVDAQGNKWDVKGFNSYYRPSKGGFSLQRDADKVDDSLREGENVMLDTSTMTPNDIAALRAEGAARGWGDKVVYWP